MSVAVSQKPVEFSYCMHSFSNSELSEVDLRICNICQNWTNTVGILISKAVLDMNSSKRITEIEHQFPVLGEFKSNEELVDDYKLSSVCSKPTKFVTKLNFNLTIKKVEGAIQPLKLEINGRVIQSETPAKDYLESLIKDMLTLEKLPNPNEESLSKGLRLLAVEGK